MKKLGIDIGSENIKAVVLEDGSNSVASTYCVPVAGRLFRAVADVFAQVMHDTGPDVRIGITGVGSKKVVEQLGLSSVNDAIALVSAVSSVAPDAEAVIEMGAGAPKYISLKKNEKNKTLELEDIIVGGKCSGATGSFIDYMWRRLEFQSLESFMRSGLDAEPVGISGRCTVFAESDITHQYQKGTPKPDIVAGLHQSLARNFKSLFLKGNSVKERMVFVGGCSLNPCMKKYLEQELGLPQNSIYVPDNSMYLSAVGAALQNSEISKECVNLAHAISALEKESLGIADYDSAGRIQLKTSVIMDAPEQKIKNQNFELAALGIDIGSVSTKAAVVAELNGKYEVLASYYRRTEGNPLEAVKDTISKIQSHLKDSCITIDKLVASTTGSGRYLTANFVGADLIKDEISAQAAGVSTYVDGDVTIIEIGGQDSKFLRIENGAIADFEMNWACAAGTGALIEKIAKNIGIRVEDFGDYALRGGRPPVINSTCAVFAENALKHFQQNKISLENLCAAAGLAVAKNYITKVVRRRQIGDKVAFQGATALNKGLVAAFETLLEGRSLVVSPFPHLTGAIGAAKLAYEQAVSIGINWKSSFRGFDSIIASRYSLKAFNCQGCGNECSVNMFQLGSEKFYQGDRCDKYSTLHKKKHGRAREIPDLFQEREALMMSAYTKKAPEGAKKIAYPRGIMFDEYYPFFNAFFTELGFDLVVSEKTNTKIIKAGLEKTCAETCFPIKVAHGHAAVLLEEMAGEFDWFFMPAIMSADSAYGSFDINTTCPYIQSAPDVLSAALGISKDLLISPELFFDRGYKHLRRKLGEIGKKMGKKYSDVEKALQVAVKTQIAFKDTVQQRGVKVLKELRSETAFVVLGRPYSIYDSRISMDVGKKISEEGYLAIPIDFLSLHCEEFDPAKNWPNLYPVQGQKKLAAAEFIKAHPNLHALVITYFGCGPDAFIDQMFKETLDRHYLTIQVDDHTSDTGVITRIQAHLNSAKPHGKEAQKEIDARDTSIIIIKGRKKLWIPPISPAAKVFAACLNAHGVDADVLPLSSDSGLGAARKLIEGDVCTPMLFTTEYMLGRASQPDFDSGKEAFFQGKSCGPCRYGLYHMLQKIVLNKKKQGIEVVTLGNRNNSSGLGPGFTIQSWVSLVAYDVLEKMLLHTRPYEKTSGESEKVFDRYVNDICSIVRENKVDSPSKIGKAFLLGSTAPYEEVLSAARNEFSAIAKNMEKRSLVGVVGEFFVRLHEPANAYVVKKIEALGGEVWLAPMTEFFGYSSYITGFNKMDAWRDSGKIIDFAEASTRMYVLNNLAKREEHRLFKASLPYMCGFDEIPPEQVVRLGSKHFSPFFGGEPIVSMGKAEDFIMRGLDGIINVIPFNCMPGLAVSAKSRSLKQNVPFITLDFDGFDDGSRDVALEYFMAQVNERTLRDERKAV